MAVSNNNPNRGKSARPDGVSIKWVKKAKMFARTEFKDGKQGITWHEERPAA
jgi:hypothetical protein